MSSGIKRHASRKTPSPSTPAKRARKSSSSTDKQLPVVTLSPAQPKSELGLESGLQRTDGTSTVQEPQSADFIVANSATEQVEREKSLKQGISETITDISITSSQEDSDGDFDIIKPSLIKQLRKILDQYPDDGQILKELLQNAEDAGASQVKFLCDYHQHGTEKLHHPDMKKFQGPALYAYNNETFTAEDWDGIRMVSDSIKNKDPMKVGRFGLGFKSVYHITDLPSIVSDKQVGMIDPHEIYFSGGTGRRWRFKQDRSKMNQIPDQFAPYEGLFGFEAESHSGRFDGTIFRFPLREKASSLSDNLYSPEKVVDLLESFKADAHLVLLFLKKLECIELYVREKEESSPRKTFDVKIAEECLENVRDKRKEFIEKVRHLKRGEVPCSPISLTYPVAIECTSYEGHDGPVRSSYTYIVTNYFSGGQMSSEVKMLMEAEDLSYLPWVGVAMAVEHAKVTGDTKGHLLCFLPLPMQKQSLTGLPVHVNGFFALSQNRRHLKWPTADQEEGGKELTDKSLQWNKFLVKEVVPRAYADLLMNSIEMSRKEVPVEVFYKAWPDPERTDPNWQDMLPPLFEQLLKCATFYTSADGGMWIQMKEAIFDTLKEDNEVLLEVLNSANTKIVTVPKHVMHVIAQHCGDVADITPRLVRDTLRRCPSCYVNRTRREKLLLLKYVLKDLRFDDLYDLELLPLSNGTFTKFLQKDLSREPIYVPTKEHSQSLLPGLDHLFLDSQSDVEEDICLGLEQAADLGVMQLQRLDENAFKRLLPNSLPCDWSSGDEVTWFPGNQGHPSEKWLELVWSYLSKHFPDDLSEFEHQPLIPVSISEDKVTLARLRSPSKLVLQSSPKRNLNATVANMLKNIGISVISELPNFVMTHKAVKGKYVHPPSVSSVLQAMVALIPGSSDSRYQTLVGKLNHQSPRSKRALRVFISKASKLRCAECTELVKHLPLFETLKDSASKSSRFVAAQEIPNAAPREVLPVEIFREMIDIRHEGSEVLARLSGVTVLKATELLDEIVLEDVRKRKYKESDVDELMKHVLDHFAEYKEEMPKFQQIMKTVPFVTKRNGERVKPSDLFDPKDASLRNLLAHEDVFPQGSVYTTRGALAILSELGLKGEKDLKSSDVLRSVRIIETLPEENARQKAVSLLDHLNSHNSCLLETVEGQLLGNCLKKITWVPRMAGPPPSYPESLPFGTKNAAHFLKPTQVTSSKFADVIGSAVPVVALENNCLTKLADFFGWTKPPDTKYIVSHLKKVVEYYTETDKVAYMFIVKKIYQYLLHLGSSERTDILAKLRGKRWIWNGEGFSTPSSMVLEKSSIDLSPYVYPLPSEVTEFKEVFIAGGMRDECEKSLLLRVSELMKEKYDKEQNPRSEDVKRDLKLAIDILNKLKPSPGNCLDEEVRERLLIPTNVTDDTTLCLAPIRECTYGNEERLKQAHDTSDVVKDGDIAILFVHRDIPNNTAEVLGVPSHTSRTLDADELDVVEAFGQEESLTCSINRLLEGYTDGFAVSKELIQNADDAGATEVKFLYDERTNEDCMTCLFDEGMKDCQGPALWAYNNAMFTPEDFTNIIKLNGATKKGDTEKIGRFGSGFNAVYNLTDVPSFVSGNSFVIFDPHKTHLGKAIRNGKPGIKISLHEKQLRTFANQFKPFNGIFGCDLGPEAGQDPYNGTLFRFPLRTKEQAVKSELKNLHYTDQEMRKLLSKLVEGSESLLLFTQTVCRVSIHHLRQSSSVTLQPEKLFEVTKSADRVIRKVSLSFSLPPSVERFLNSKQQDFARQSSFLRASSHALKTMNCSDESQDFPRSSMVIDVEMKQSKKGAKFFGSKYAKQNSFSYLVTSAMGTSSAFEYSKEDTTLLPTGGVAVQLLRKSGKLSSPKPIVDPEDKSKSGGKVFCYLPLPLRSGVPVHVNGFFAVASNRRHLKGKTDDDKYHSGGDWNEALMEDAVSEAYISSLEDLKSLLSGRQDSYDIFELWPRAENVARVSEKVCQTLVNAFYRRLLAGPSFPSLFSDGRKWFSIEEAVFLHPDLRTHQGIGNIALEVFKTLTPVGKVVVDLPFDIMESIKQCGLEDSIKTRTFCIRRFYCDIFLPSINRIPAVQRDPLVIYAVSKRNLRELLNKFPCIPASPNGRNLKRPQELFHPSGHARSLYRPDDGMFPHGTSGTFLNPALLEKLTEELGMRKDTLTWEEVVERAHSIQILNQEDHKGALKRTQALIRFLNDTLTTKGNVPPSPNARRLLKANFLPILQRPKRFPLRWKGDEYEPHALLAPSDVFKEKSKNLVSCIRPILDDSVDGCGPLARETADFLGFGENDVCLDDVKAQLETIINSKTDFRNHDVYKTMEKLLVAVYKYLQKHLDQKRKQIVPFLAGKTFILGKTHLLMAKQVAFEPQVHFTPYLYELPRDLAARFRKLMSEAGVREFFDENDFYWTLQSLKERFGDDVLDDASVKLTVELVSLIDSYSGKEQLPIKPGVFLPDTSKRLYPCFELCIKDCYWMPDEIGVKYVHPNFPPQICINFGVNTRRQETLRKCSKGIRFGQHEKLTTRIKRILKAYPSENGLLKELLQNADDAQATELCFIKDPRHHEELRVFEDSWKPLQGPALCVYNNKPFTEADIVGIQNLGEGSKSHDPNKTGQYGVGFNAVYHLTDAPSFLSSGSEVGQVLCVFDPQCKFVPGATLLEPGRMFRDINNLKETFTDVFRCYLGEHFSAEGSTMFRFPLRTEKMAQESEICSAPVEVDDLTRMMDHFKLEVFEALLFVTYVRKITLCEVHKNGKLANVYEVTSSLSEKDAIKLAKFTKYVTDVGHQLRDKRLSLTDVQMNEVSYVVDLKDNKGVHEKWLVVQRIGFEPGVDVPDRLLGAFRAEDLCLLPRGGVASCLQRLPSSQANKPKKAFCFLPLPFKTGLPVHINGHFALDQARRHLWQDEGGGYRTDWNNLLLCCVVAPCYASLLVNVREHLQLSVSRSGISLLECEHLAQTRLTTYLGLFPSLKLEDTYWVKLAEDLYQYIHKKGVRLLPVLRTVTGFVPKRGTRSSSRKTRPAFSSEITWFPPNGQSTEKAFFNNLEAIQEQSEGAKSQRKQNERLRNVLLSTGLNLLEAPMNIYDNFIASGVHVDCLSPAIVVKFFSTYSSCQPLRGLDNLPQAVQDTPFKDVRSVVLLLQYCKERFFAESLQGLPLLVTQDNTVRVFDSLTPAFLTDHVGLLSQCKSEVVHRSLYNEIFKEECFKKQLVFKVLDVDSLARNLNRILPDSWYCTNNGFAQWSPEKKQENPSASWISNLWKFLAGETKSILLQKDLDATEKGRRIAAKLTPLSDWCLLPATEIGTENDRQYLGTSPRHFLVPMCMANTVLNFGKENVLPLLREALRALRLPELDTKVIDGGSVALNYSEPARMIVANPSNPHQVLRALSAKIGSSSAKELAHSEHYNQILGYFRDHITLLHEEDKETLRMLPFYLTVHGEHTALLGRKVYVVPKTIPNEGINLWQGTTGEVFLKENPSLSKLHAFLGSTSCTEVAFYCDFILQHFGDMNPKDRLAHLEHLKSRLLTLSKPDESRLLLCLRNVGFLPQKDGSLRTTSSFYDPEVPVFKEMLHPGSFPQSPFSCPDKWLPFLRQIGLTKEVSETDFVNFAHQVANEAKGSRNDRTPVKSGVLLRHLFQRPDLETGGILEKIRKICFIQPYKVSERLSCVLPQFGMARNDELPYICFEGAVVSAHEYIAWTSAPLLSPSADPRCQNISRRLGILSEPTLEHVISHCEKVCLFLAKENSSSCLDKDVVLVAIYRFLQRHKDPIAKSRLKNVPCILVDTGNLVLPCKIVIDFMSEREITPYLLKAPAKLGEFHDLFLFLGSTQVVTIEQYAEVLVEIQMHSGDAKLGPNELKKSFQAVKGLFEMLENVSVEDIEVPVLYLPGAKREEPRQVYMRKSTELVLDDAPDLRARITRFDELLLVDLQQCNLKATNFGRLVQMLPEKFRPQMLTSLVQESLSVEAVKSPLQGSARRLKHLLTSQHFARAIVRLIRHEDSKTRRKTEPDTLDLVKQRLSGIQVHGIEGLKTHLLYRREIIPASETKKACFAEKIDEEWNVFLEISGGHERSSILRVAEIVNEITGGRLKGTMVLPELLSCTTSELWPLLDELRILEDLTSELDQAAYLPQPGTFIHIEDHYLLKDAFEDFEPGEYVGYEPCDRSFQSEDDTPTIIYAVIIEEVKPEGIQTVSVLKKKYKIDLGNDKHPIEVDAVDLYKFRRVKEAPYEGGKATPVGSTPHVQPKSLEELKVEITEFLKEARDLRKEKRITIIRRLYLTWHPDKNPGNEEFCTKVFQYLQEEIRRLGAIQGHSSRGTFGSSFKNWDQRAQKHHDHFKEDHASAEDRFHRANPQPGEARRWFRQARADLKAAASDFSMKQPSYEWVCFKSHQAAEKALKAAQYSKDANKTNQHNLSAIASGLDNAELSSLASDLERLLGGSARMRYPDKICFPQIPHDVYDQEMASKARNSAERILDEANKFIESRI